MDTPTPGAYEHVLTFRVGALEARPGILEVLHDAYHQQRPVPATSRLFGNEYHYQYYVTRYSLSYDAQGYTVYEVGTRIDMATVREADILCLRRHIGEAYRVVRLLARDEALKHVVDAMETATAAWQPPGRDCS